jgi:hypothetical protein
MAAGPFGCLAEFGSEICAGNGKDSKKIEIKKLVSNIKRMEKERLIDPLINLQQCKIWI